MPSYFFGLDGGQSGMRALIADESGRVVGRSHSEGPTSPTDGEGAHKRFETTLRTSVLGARLAADLPEDTVYRAACFGFSGGPEDKDALARTLVRAKDYLITHDAWIALAGATAGKPGIVVIAGTGSIAFGRNAEGTTARAGGWGFAFGDEGGAFDLGRQAIRAALRQEEGWGPPTALRDALIAATATRDVNDLMHRYYSGELSRERIAGLARTVDTIAGQGDPVAKELMGSAAQSLALLAGAVRNQLFGETEAVDVRYTGGVFQSAPVLQRFQLLVEMGGESKVSAAAHPPVAGALLEAFRIAGANCTLKEVSN